MKYKRILIFIFFIIVFSNFTVSAEEFELEGAQKVKSALSDEGADFFGDFNIEPDTTEWISSLTPKNVFSHIREFLQSGATKPIKIGATALTLITVTALIDALSSNSETSKTAIFICRLSLTVFLCVEVYSVISSSVSAVKGTATFMLSFIPMYAGIIAVSGGVATSVTMSTMLLGAAEAVGMLAAYFIVPIMSGYLSVSICSAVSPLISNNSVGETLKKIALWALSLLSTVFLGILSIQTAVNSSADSLTLRTSKFIIGTTVPVAGQVLSEAAATVTASMQVLRSTVGIYGVLALCFFFLPILAELLIWRITMMLLTVISEILESGKVSGIFKSVDAMLSLLIGVILLIAALFIISLTVVISTGKPI